MSNPTRILTHLTASKEAVFNENVTIQANLNVGSLSQNPNFLTGSHIIAAGENNTVHASSSYAVGTNNVLRKKIDLNPIQNAVLVYDKSDTDYTSVFSTGRLVSFIVVSGTGIAVKELTILNSSYENSVTTITFEPSEPMFGIYSSPEGATVYLQPSVINNEIYNAIEKDYTGDPVGVSVSGYLNKISSNYSLVAGAANAIYNGNYNLVSGEDNRILGDRNLVSGLGNQLNGSFNIVSGVGNIANASEAAVFGTSNKVIGQGSLSSGAYNTAGVRLYSFEGFTYENGYQELYISGNHTLEFVNGTILHFLDENEKYVVSVTVNSSRYFEEKTYVTLYNPVGSLYNFIFDEYKVLPGVSFDTLGRSSTTRGSDNKSYADYSEASGNNTKALGINSKSSGLNTVAYGENSIAEGSNTKAIGDRSKAYGNNSVAYTNNAQAGGSSSGAGYKAYGVSIVNGEFTVPGEITGLNGESTYVIDNKLGLTKVTINNVNYSEENIQSTIVLLEKNINGSFLVLEGRGQEEFIESIYSSEIFRSKITQTDITNVGYNSFAFGQEVSAVGENSVAYGQNTLASGVNSFADGYKTKAIGDNSVALGNESKAFGENSFASGFFVEATGQNSVAYNFETKAVSDSSFAVGKDTQAGALVAPITITNGVFTRPGNVVATYEGTTFNVIVDNIVIPVAVESAVPDEELGITTITLFQKVNSNYIVLSGINSSGGQISGLVETAEKINFNGGTKIGNTSRASGEFSFAFGQGSNAEGYQTIAGGNYSHAEGYSSKASGNISHAEGLETLAAGESSHAEGYSTKAQGNSSHAEGDNTYAISNKSHTEGERTVAGYKYLNVNIVNGVFSLNGNFTDIFVQDAEVYLSNEEYGISVGVVANSSHDEETDVTTVTFTSLQINSDKIFLSGVFNEIIIHEAILAKEIVRQYPDLVTTVGNGSHAEGLETFAAGTNSHSEGYGTLALADYSHAEGQNSRAIGLRSHAEGANTIAKGVDSHAEGNGSKSFGNASHAEGFDTLAYAQYSHAEGQSTVAYGISSHAEGAGTVTSGSYSHAEGGNTRANADRSHSEGLVTQAGIKVLENVFSIVDGTFTVQGDIRDLNEITGGRRAYILVNNKIEELIWTLEQISYDEETNESTVTTGTPVNATTIIIDGIDVSREGHILDICEFSRYLNNLYSLSISTLGNNARSSGQYTFAFGVNSTASGFGTMASGANSVAQGVNTIASGGNSIAQGSSAVASGEFAIAQGSGTVASGAHALAQGCETEASGDCAHAEGHNTVASGDYSHAEGVDSVSSGVSSHAEGDATIASGHGSHAEGNSSVASGEYSHAEGHYSNATGNSSHAEGGATTASGLFSHSEGQSTLAVGVGAHAEGNQTIANGNSSHAEGMKTVSGAKYVNITVTNGEFSLVGDIQGPWPEKFYALDNTGALKLLEVGNKNGFDGTNSSLTLQDLTINGSFIAFFQLNSATLNDGLLWPVEENFWENNPPLLYGPNSHAEGEETLAIGISSHAEGYMSIASGAGAHAEGYRSIASGDSSHAEGELTVASGIRSHAEGSEAKSSGLASHAEGYKSEASGNAAHAEGSNTTASGNYSHAEGNSSVASGEYSHAEGQYTVASGLYSHAEGSGTKAVYDGSHAEGVNTVAVAANSHAEGRESKAGDYNLILNIENGVATLEANVIDEFIEGEILKLIDADNKLLQLEIQSCSLVDGNTQIVFAESTYSGETLLSLYLAGKNPDQFASLLPINQMANTEGSHAEGENTLAVGSFSKTSGKGTIAFANHQYALGKFNKINDGALVLVGNGVDQYNRSNILEVYDNLVVVSGTLSASVGQFAQVTASNGLVEQDFTVLGTLSASVAQAGQLTASNGLVENDLTVEGVSSGSVGKFAQLTSSFSLTEFDSTVLGTMSGSVVKAGELTASNGLVEQDLTILGVNSGSVGKFAQLTSSFSLVEFDSTVLGVMSGSVVKAGELTASNGLVEQDLTILGVNSGSVGKFAQLTASFGLTEFDFTVLGTMSGSVVKSAQLTSSNGLVEQDLTVLGVSSGSVGKFANLTASYGLVENDLRVQGNLKVEGNLTYLDTQNLLIKDKRIVVASGSADTVEESGLYVGFDGEGTGGTPLASISVKDDVWNISASAGVTIAATSSVDLTNICIDDPSVSGKLNVEKTFRAVDSAFGNLVDIYQALRFIESGSFDPNGSVVVTLNKDKFVNAELNNIVVDVMVRETDNDSWTNDLVSVYVNVSNDTYCEVTINAPAAPNWKYRLSAVNENPANYVLNNC